MPGPTRPSPGSALRAPGASASGFLLPNGAPAPGPGYLYDLNELADPALLEGDDPAPDPAADLPPAVVLERFGLDLTTLTDLNQTARLAETFLDRWFQAHVDDPASMLKIKDLDAATNILWRLASVRKTLFLLSRLPVKAPDPVREKRRIARVLSEAITKMRAHNMVPKRPSTPGRVKVSRPAPIAKPQDPQAALTPPVPHPLYPPDRPPAPVAPPRPPAKDPARPQVCPTLDLSNYTTSTSAHAWSLRALIQTEALLQRNKITNSLPSESPSASASESESVSYSATQSQIPNPKSEIGDEILARFADPHFRKIYLSRAITDPEEYENTYNRNTPPPDDS